MRTLSETFDYFRMESSPDTVIVKRTDCDSDATLDSGQIHVLTLMTIQLFHTTNCAVLFHSHKGIYMMLPRDQLYSYRKVFSMLYYYP